MTFFEVYSYTPGMDWLSNNFCSNNIKLHLLWNISSAVISTFLFLYTLYDHGTHGVSFRLWLLRCIPNFPDLKEYSWLSCIEASGADVGGGCRGAHPPPPWDESFFVFTFKICLSHRSVTSFLRGAPPPKKKPGSAPELCYFIHLNRNHKSNPRKQLQITQDIWGRTISRFVFLMY